MESLHFEFTLLDPSPSAKNVVIAFDVDCPDWWIDATFKQRNELLRKLIDRSEILSKVACGYIILNIRQPPCACLVNAVADRDPYWERKGHCIRCGGPLD